VPLDPVEIAALVAAAFAGSVIFGVTGFGAALVTVPFATHFVPLPFALALYVLMDLANAFRIGFENPKNAVKSEWTRMIPTILIGTVIGLSLLVNLPRAAATFALGVFVFAFAVYSLARHPGVQRVLHAGWAYAAGLTGGVTSTLFGAGGPAYAMYLSHRGLTKEQYRATLGLTTLTSISIRTVAFFAVGFLLDPKVWLYAVFVVPSGLVGIWAASHLFRRMSRDILMRAVALMLLASGASLIVRAVS
jgi:uncharacterized membrane protein YfcA